MEVTAARKSPSQADNPKETVRGCGSARDDDEPDDWAAVPTHGGLHPVPRGHLHRAKKLMKAWSLSW